MREGTGELWGARWKKREVKERSIEPIGVVSEAPQ